MSTRVWSVLVVFCGLAALAGCGASTGVSSSGWTARRAAHDAVQVQQQPKFSVTMLDITSVASVRETQVTVRQILEQGDPESKYHAILDGPATGNSPSTGFFATGTGSPFVEVHAGRAYLWGIFPSGRTRRVVTASQAAGQGGAPAPISGDIIIQIDGNTHRFVNVGTTSISIDVAPGRTLADGQGPFVIGANMYRNITEVQGDDPALPLVAVGAQLEVKGETEEAAAVREMIAELEAKKATFQYP